MNKQKLRTLLTKEGCSEEFIKIALKQKHRFGGDILSFIKTVEFDYATHNMANSICEDFLDCTSDDAGILISELNYYGNTLEAHGYIFETDDGRKF